MGTSPVEHRKAEPLPCSSRFPAFALCRALGIVTKVNPKLELGADMVIAPDSPKATQMQHRTLDGHLEAIARDAPVKADYIADRTTTHARLGETLQRLFAPAAGHPPDRFGQLLTLLDQRLGQT
jgi:hypothetical protein